MLPVFDRPALDCVDGQVARAREACGEAGDAVAVFLLAQGPRSFTQAEIIDSFFEEGLRRTDTSDSDIRRAIIDALLLAPSSVMGTGSTPVVFLAAIPESSPLSSFSLTASTRHPRQEGCRAGIAARSAAQAHIALYGGYLYCT